MENCQKSPNLRNASLARFLEKRKRRAKSKPVGVEQASKRMMASESPVEWLRTSSNSISGHQGDGGSDSFSSQLRSTDGLLLNNNSKKEEKGLKERQIKGKSWVGRHVADTGGHTQDLGIGLKSKDERT